MQRHFYTLAVNVHAIQALDSAFGLKTASELDYDVSFRPLHNVVAWHFDFDDLAKAFEVASELLFL